MGARSTTFDIDQTLKELLQNSGGQTEAMKAMSAQLEKLEKKVDDLQRDFDKRVPDDLRDQLKKLQRTATQGETIATALDKTGVLKLIGGAALAGLIGAGGLYAAQSTLEKPPQRQQQPYDPYHGEEEYRR